MKLTHAASGQAQTVNVEYNQIDALLKATVDPRGDVAPEGGNGYSPYPGSINQVRMRSFEPWRPARLPAAALGRRLRRHG